MLKNLLAAGATAACLIGSAQPAQAKLTDCWFFTPTQQYDVSPQDCDVTRRTEPSSRTTSGYLHTWIIRSNGWAMEAVLWDDDSAEITVFDPRGVVEEQFESTWQYDSHGDRYIDLTDGYAISFEVPTSDYGAGAAYPPAFGGGRESYQPIRGGGLSSGEFSSRPFHF